AERPIPACRRSPLPGSLSTVPAQGAGPHAGSAVAHGARRFLMARLPAPVEKLIEEFGPHVHRAPAGGWTPIGEPDRLVKTHCCFCGQQCGIQLKVKDERVIGFEPWEDFPFNQGKLCPKGVKRYLQDEHPDRLLSPLERVESRGFQPASWETALD